MIIAIIVILLITCIILTGFLVRKKHIDTETEIYNQQLRENNKLLIDCNKKLKNDNDELSNEKNLLDQAIYYKTKEKDSLFNSIEEKKNVLADLTYQQELSIQTSEQAYSNYVDLLHQKYVEVEVLFDTEILSLNNQREEIKNELDKLKATRAAAHEALLKEQLIKDNKDNYRLVPSDSDLADSRRLELVKKELNKPRILCMLIWQTYWQPLAKKQFPIILQNKTKCGIYKITNLITDECYIGQAVDIYKRWCEHCKCGLGIDTPPGNKLYKSIQEYGLDNFTFELIEECSQSELNEKEKYFIELYQSDTFGFNGQKGNSK